MKSLVDLQAVLLLESGRKCGAPFVVRDVETLRQRVKHEGDSFITITLPNFCKDFERCLSEGRVGPGSFLSFKRERSGIPSFLKGFLSNVFDSQGCLLASPSIDCIRAIRQVCLFGKKVLRPCSEERVKAAVEGYAQCDDGLSAPSDAQMHRYFQRVSTLMWSALLEGQDFESCLVPKHGPGATQERISGNQKWRFRLWNRRLTDVGFSYVKFGRGSQTGSLPCRFHTPPDVECRPELVEPQDEEPVRVVLVPKTLKTPRVIAVEPVVMQYAQQALLGWIVGRLESHPLTAGHVNFRDQSVNQSIALAGSETGHLATLDMAEASDRVSLAHVTEMLSSVPRLRDWVLACRSARAKLPTGEVLTLKKFASMGSALCFPMEAMAFYCAIVASRIRRAGRFPTAHLVQQCTKDVYVYGDDLIVPSDEAPAICDDLESLGFKVNRSKSFWTGHFRESCGVDAYAGESVTPIYLRHDVPTDRGDASGLLSCIATSNQLYSAGYEVTSAALRKAVERVLGPLPQVPYREEDNTSKPSIVQEGPAIGWIGHSNSSPPKRYNKALQRLERRVLVPVVTWMDDPLEGLPALAKCWGLIGSKDPIDSLHLERSSRPYSLTLKRRWVPAHTVLG